MYVNQSVSQLAIAKVRPIKAQYDPVRLSKAQQGKVSKGKQRQAKMHKAMN